MGLYPESTQKIVPESEAFRSASELYLWESFGSNLRIDIHLDSHWRVQERSQDVAEGPPFSAPSTEAVLLKAFTGSLPTHSSQKGGRAKGGMSPADRSSLGEEEKGRE